MSGSWNPCVSGELAENTLEIVRTVARRICCPQGVAVHITGQSSSSPAGLGNGYSGLALALFYLGQQFPELPWSSAAHTYLRLAAQMTRDQHLPYPGVFGGTGGLALILSAFAGSDPRYQRTSQRINQAVARQIVEKPWPRRTAGSAQREYDTISGAAGIIGSLLSLGENDALIQEALHISLHYLLWLAGDIEEHQRKHWFIPPELMHEIALQKYPDGCFNLGLAHGIPGPLAALSLAWAAGYRLPSMREAMRTMASWIVEHCVYDAWGRNWPAVVLPNGQPSEPEGTFAGWCYGAPGVARALWLAGRALEDDSLCHLAVESIEAVLRRPGVVRRVCSPTLCHGLGGLLLICLHFAHEIHSPLIREHIPLLVRQILEGFCADVPFGFRDETWEGTRADHAGMLTGAAGVALTLLAASTSSAPLWDRAFLIA